MKAQVTRLMVLGVLRLRQPTHGYEIQRELERWRADQWAGISRPSVYNQFRTLSREALIAVVSVQPGAQGPSKTQYEITAAGEREFQRLLRDVIENAQPQPLDLMPALCFLPALTEREVVAALEARIAVIDAFLRQFDEGMDEWFPADHPAPYIAEVFLLTREGFRGERTWAEGFLGRVRAGRYRLA